MTDRLRQAIGKYTHHRMDRVLFEKGWAKERGTGTIFYKVALAMNRNYLACYHPMRQREATR